jgi:hypothetical protein
MTATRASQARGAGFSLRLVETGLRGQTASRSAVVVSGKGQDSRRLPNGADNFHAPMKKLPPSAAQDIGQFGSSRAGTLYRRRRRKPAEAPGGLVFSMHDLPS